MRCLNGVWDDIGSEGIIQVRERCYAVSCGGVKKDGQDQDMNTIFNLENSHSSPVRGHLTLPSFCADISSKA